MIDRADPSVARETIEALFADPQVRATAAKLLADLIEVAHKSKDDSWAVTLRPSGENKVRLNVGRVQVFALQRESVWAVVELDSLEPGPRTKLEPFVVKRGDYKTEPEAVDLEVPADRLVELSPLLRETVGAFAKHAARYAAHFRSTYSPAVPSYLSELLDRSIPDPGFIDEDPGAAEIWDEFVLWAKRFYEDPDFDAEERDYKLEFADTMARVRRLVEADDPDWPHHLHEAWKDTNLIRWQTREPFEKLIDADRDGVRRVLLDLWNEDEPLDQRLTDLDAFVADVDTPGTRVSLAAALLMAVDPLRYQPYLTTIVDAAESAVGWVPLGERDAAGRYQDALAFYGAVTGESTDRGLDLRDDLDGQSVVWAVFRNALPDDATQVERTQLERFRGNVPRVWWVNQGKRGDQVQDLFASLADRRGKAPAHWLNVSRVRRGDVVLHYFDQAVHGISTVDRNPTIAPRPLEPDAPDGRFAKVRFIPLERPIPREDIPMPWRLSERGPFNKHGKVNQGYLYELSDEFAERVRTEFWNYWPAGSPWAATENRWLFQANPDRFDLTGHLTSWDIGNEDTWTVKRHKDEYREGDDIVIWQSGDEAGAYALGVLTSEPFDVDELDWDSDAGPGPFTQVKYRLTRKLEPPVYRRDLLDDPILSQLGVIRQPQGTNYRVTAEQWEALVAAASPTETSTEPLPGRAHASVDAIHAHLTKLGMRIARRTTARFHHSLATRGFVVLSGISGTGKTWLAELYAEAIGAPVCHVAVAPNWTTNEDLLGWSDPISGTYRHTEFSTFLMAAAAAHEQATSAGADPLPHLLLLDEMNLARVEYYFAKFLSAMEVRSRNGFADLHLANDLTVRLHPNLWFVGTVNVDETTHGFADKVYDRAQLIELTIDRTAIANHLGTAPYAGDVLAVWDLVREVKPFAFRIIDEIKTYADQVENAGGTWEEALDDQLLQKVITKLNGSDPRLGPALEGLAELTETAYPLTYEKVVRMRDQFAEHGFASYF